MLDARADLRLRVVGAPRRLRHRPALGLLAMDLADEAVLVEEGLVGRGAIGAIGPDSLGRVGGIEQALAQPRALIGGRIRHQPALDQAVLAVDRDMILIAEGGNGDVDRRHRAVRLRLGLGELDGPARVTVLPGLGNAPGLDLVLLLFGVALPGCRN